MRKDLEWWNSLKGFQRVDLAGKYCKKEFFQVDATDIAKMYHGEVTVLTPIPLQNPDFNVIIKMCQDHLKAIEEGTDRDDDDYWFYEVAMTTVYGKDIFDYINKKRR